MPDKKENLIQDFGEKIGGARKDLWLQRGGLVAEDLLDLNEKEILKYTTKANIWPKYDYKSMYENGESSLKQLFFVKSLYDALPAKPTAYNHAEIENYIEFLHKTRDYCNKILMMEPGKFIGGLADRSIFYDYVKETNIGRVEPSSLYAPFRWNYSSSFLQYTSSKFLKAFQQREDDIIKNIVTKEFLASYKDLIKMTTRIIPTGTDLVNISKDYKGRTQIGVSNASKTSRFYFYPADGDKVVKGDFILYNPYAKYNPVLTPLFKECHPHKTLEDAINDIDLIGKSCELAQETMEKVESVLKAINKEKEKEEKAKKSKANVRGITAETENYRRGPEIINENINITGEDYLNTFGFRGGEFGNWLSQEDRQNVLNTGFVAFHDLAYALGVNPQDISLGGTLAIAFGARGRGGKFSAAAHYESLREVINLTKMNGAGCLAHEFGHALDNYLSTHGMVQEVNDLKDKLQNKIVHEEPSRDKSDKEINKEAKAMLNFIKYGIDGNYKRTPFSEEDEKQIKEIFVKYFTVERDNKDSTLMSDVVNLVNGSVKASDISNKRLGELNTLLSQHNIKLGKDAVLKICYKLNTVSSQARHILEDGLTYKTKTDYLKDSITIGANEGLSNYYQKPEEMFARAFDQYINDILAREGIKSIFLSNAAKSGPTPKGEEREQFAEMFNQLIDAAKEKNLLTNCNDLNHYYENARANILSQEILQQNKVDKAEVR